MGASSLIDPSSDAKRVLEGQLRECFGRVVYTHKTHEKCADLLLRRLSRIKLAQIVLSALTTGGFISTLFGGDKTAALGGLVLSTILLVLNAYTKNYDLGELAQKHKQAANEIWLIREKYLSLIADFAGAAISMDAARVERDQLLVDLHAAYAGSPSTTYAAYRQAQKALQRNEDMTFSDQEIDAFLPRDLRRTSI